MAQTLTQRAQGALLGAFIGDALALGPHWYYDLDAMRRDYGDWVDDYTDPQSERYHGGMHAGQSSQAGWLLELTLQSLTAAHGYDEADFCRRLDDDFLPLIDGTPHNGPGGYTSQSMREAWQLRVQQQRPWGRVGGYADNTEAAERTLAIAVRYAQDPAALARHVSANTALTQIDPTVGALTTAYCSTLGLLVGGEPLDAGITGKLMARVRSGDLPFHTVTSPGEDKVPAGPEQPRTAGHFASPDALIGIGSIVGAATDPAVRIEPAWKVAQVYGMPCSVYHQFPAAYHLAARFADDFEAAVLHAVNSGGQNMARAMLTGALVGAQVGIDGIPRRFIDGLERGATYQALAQELARQMQAPPE